jgi:mercuric ion binding protein
MKKQLLRIILLAIAFAPVIAWGADSIEEVTLKVDGITCGSCIREIKSELLKVDGVKTAEIMVSKKKWIFFDDYSSARARIQMEQGKVTVEALVAAVERAGTPVSPYRATLVPE